MSVLAFFMLFTVVTGFQPPGRLYFQPPFGPPDMTGFDAWENCDVDGPPKICFALDFDGTLVEAGEKLKPKEEAMFRRIKELGIKVFIITAQSVEYMLDTVDPNLFEGIICECNLDLIKPNGEVVKLVNIQSMLPVHLKIEKCIRDMKWDFQVNRKRAGFAVDLKGASEEQVEFLYEKISRMAECKNMRVVMTTGFIDYMLPPQLQSKCRGLRFLKHRYPDYMFLAAGDSVATDGPMLELADTAYIVGGSDFEGARSLSGPKMVIKLLSWLEFLCKMPED